MAPKPLSTTIRTSRSASAKPAIYAIHAGPQRGVHLLSADPIPPSTQYLYRHPINVHRTFLSLTGDFLRRRFDSIEAAVRWIDERDRERELADALAGTSISSPAGPEDTREMVRELHTLRANDLPPPTPCPRERQRRASDPVYKYAPQSMAQSGGIRKDPRVVAVRGKYGMTHLGVRRRDLLYSLVAQPERGEGSGVGKGKEVEVEVERDADAMETEEEEL